MRSPMFPGPVSWPTHASPHQYWGPVSEPSFVEHKGQVYRGHLHNIRIQIKTKEALGSVSALVSRWERIPLSNIDPVSPRGGCPKMSCLSMSNERGASLKDGTNNRIE